MRFSVGIHVFVKKIHFNVVSTVYLTEQSAAPWVFHEISKYSFTLAFSSAPAQQPHSIYQLDFLLLLGISVLQVEGVWIFFLGEHFTAGVNSDFRYPSSSVFLELCFLDVSFILVIYPLKPGKIQQVDRLP